MRHVISIFLAVGALVLAPTASLSEPTMNRTFEDFRADAEQRWDYVADGVMGGVSQGQAAIGDGAVRLTGRVSTKNNGGFIQVRSRFAEGWPDSARGLVISAKGNGETYYVFLRTQGLARVWHSYRASFVAAPDWTETRLDFAGFTRSHQGMPDTFTPEQVISIGIVAYGRDHQADVSVRSIGLY